MWRVAVVHHGWPWSLELARLREALFRKGLVEGVNCAVDAVGAEGRLARLPLLIDQLLQRGPDVIVALGALAALSAQRATANVPIRCAIVLDPADIDLTAPNVSAVTTFDRHQATRHLRLLRNLIVGLECVILVTDTDAPMGRDGRNPLASGFLQAAAAQRIDTACVGLSGIDADLDAAFGSVRNCRAQALVALEVPAVLARLRDIARQSERLRLPMLCPYGCPDSGVVMQGTALTDAIDPLAELVVAVHRNPCVTEVPSRIVHQKRLVIHRGRAKQIGLDIPSKVLERATQLIDGNPN